MSEVEQQINESVEVKLAEIDGNDMVSIIDKPLETAGKEAG